MEIRVLQYFVTIVQEKSITKAAQKLHITQPTLSRQIKILEAQLHTTILHRGNREITLTADGRYLYNRALEILSLVTKTTQNFNEKGPLTGTITLGAAEGRSIKKVLAIAQKFQATYPAVKFEIFSGNADELIEKVNAGIIDLAIVSKSTDASLYQHLSFPSEETWGVLMPKSHPLAHQKQLDLAKLAAYPLILSDQSDAKNFFINQLGNKAQVVATFNLIYNASLMVEVGMGLAITWANLITTDNNSPLTFIPLTGDLPRINLEIFWKKNDNQSQALKIFITYLKDSFAN